MVSFVIVISRGRKMQQELFGVFWQENEMMHEIKTLFTAHRETVVLHPYNTLDGGWNQIEVLSYSKIYH